MPFKPMKRRDFEDHLKKAGWSLKKGGIDWSLYDENDKFVCTVKITHPGGEVIPMHIKKVQDAFARRGLQWEPKKSQKKK
jgi:hypothetical protein